MRPTWDEYGLIMAKAAASRAACTRSQCGAVLMDKWHRIVSAGYNGVAPGEVHCSDGGCPRGKFTYDELPPLGDYSNCPGIHAERNAVEWADFEDCRQSTLYVTREPCNDCREYVRGAGIVRIVWPEGELSYV